MKVSTDVLAATVYPKILACATVKVSVSVSSQSAASPLTTTVATPSTKVKVVDAKTEQPINYYQAFVRDSIPIFFCIAFAMYQLFSISNAGKTNFEYPNYFPRKDISF